MILKNKIIKAKYDSKPITSKEKMSMLSYKR